MTTGRVVTAALALTSGCTEQRSDQAADPLRHDKAPIERRFPAFGAVAEAPVIATALVLGLAWFAHRAFLVGSFYLAFYVHDYSLRIEPNGLRMMALGACASVAAAEQGERVSAGTAPPDSSWTAGDLDRIPGLPAHTELLGGQLVFRAAQTHFHMAALRLLENALLDRAPQELRVVREMTVTLGRRDRPEPA